MQKVASEKSCGNVQASREERVRKKLEQIGRERKEKEEKKKRWEEIQKEAMERQEREKIEEIRKKLCHLEGLKVMGKDGTEGTLKIEIGKDWKSKNYIVELQRETEENRINNESGEWLRCYEIQETYKKIWIDKQRSASVEDFVEEVERFVESCVYG